MRLLPQRTNDAMRSLRATATRLNLEACTLETPYAGLSQDTANKAADVAEAEAERLYQVAAMLRGDEDQPRSL